MSSAELGRTRDNLRELQEYVGNMASLLKTRITDMRQRIQALESAPPRGRGGGDARGATSARFVSCRRSEDDAAWDVRDTPSRLANDVLGPGNVPWGEGMVFQVCPEWSGEPWVPVMHPNDASVTVYIQREPHHVISPSPVSAQRWVSEEEEDVEEEHDKEVEESDAEGGGGGDDHASDDEEGRDTTTHTSGVPLPIGEEAEEEAEVEEEEEEADATSRHTKRTTSSRTTTKTGKSIKTSNTLKTSKASFKKRM